jgi:hypothetical protein
MTEGSGFYFWQGKRFFIPPQCPEWLWRATQPPFQFVAGDEVARGTVDVVNVWNYNYPNLTKPCQNMQVDAE